MKPRPPLADQPARILIVDDERVNRQLLEVMLTPEGFTLATAATGEAALAMVAEQSPDLILLDVMMPGMDGHEVVSRLKGDAATRNIPIVMITALNDPDVRMAGLSAGAEEFLTKPIDRAELCVRVRNLLRLKAFGAFYDTYSEQLETEVAARTADLVSRARTLQDQAVTLASQAALLDLAPGAILVRDLNSRIVFWSRGAEVLYGWSSREAVGRLSYELLKVEFPVPREEILATLLTDGHWEGEPIHYRRDGTRLIIEGRWALQHDAFGVPVGILTINNDITARKAAEAERVTLLERLSLATSVAKTGVWEWDLASDTLTWDATMCNIYGVPEGLPIRYDTWAGAVHPEDLAGVETILQRAIDQKGKESAEFRINCPDGETRHISAIERAVADDRGNVTKVIGVNVDVTSRKRAEEMLKRSNQAQIRFKDEFLSHVSHELRSPLTAIKQFTSILLGGSAGELNTEQREYQQIVMKNIGQLQAMIDDLIEVTRLETGKLTIEPEGVRVTEALADTLNTLQGAARAKGVRLDTNLPPSLPQGYADPVRLKQILIILVDNAIKFTPKGGSITIQAGLLPRDPRFLLIEVIDTGIGIGPELVGKVFDRLYQVTDRIQASRAGLGLGLYICKELVTRQDGEIWVASEPRAGSRFSFTLPVFSLDPPAPTIQDRWPAEAVALVMVEICVQHTWALESTREEWTRAARDIVQRCLPPEVAVLVPAMSFGVEGQRFLFVLQAPAERAQLVAAFVDEKGASGLADRIREQFARLPNLNQEGLSVSVSYSRVQPFRSDVDGSVGPRQN